MTAERDARWNGKDPIVTLAGQGAKQPGQRPSD
jgi:hypothetical protein